jgi:hypothetical protein
VKKALAGLLLIAVGLLMGGCGAATTSSASPNPRASPSPSPTVLTDAQLLERFLADVKPIRARVFKLTRQLAGIEKTMMAPGWYQPKGQVMSRELRKLIFKFDGILVDLQLIDAPDFMQPAMKSLVRLVALVRESWVLVADELATNAFWRLDDPGLRRLTKTDDAVSQAADAWRLKVKLEAKRWGVKVPWKWTWYW